MSRQTETCRTLYWYIHKKLILRKGTVAPRNESSLAPVDKGFGAWSFLIAAFFIEGLVWGFLNAFGVFLDGYLNDPTFLSQPHASSLLPLIRPAILRIIYCSGTTWLAISSTPLSCLLGPYNLPHHCEISLSSTDIYVGRCYPLLGEPVGFECQVSTLIGLQGVLHAVGRSLLYAPCISYMSEWFVARRGLANGIIFAGTATGGLILPLILPELISRYGTAKTSRILSVALAALLLPVLPFVKPRIPISRNQQQVAPPRSREWIKSTSFWILLAANTFQGFGYFVPIVWLPTFAHAMNLSVTNSSLTVALLNGASVLGRLSMEYLSDKFNP
ncbi:major facilitator superfamily domain-containing protein [Armillaria luteobubalina]|uniref:Major facilitator superfamily domain-containing protein n=1 Tax=Armillaria luteobubalina TaxID=153913 RepID=A0AA39UUX4_9AGAR|nr:major facilitator superfamily domain-containing protein [Armillaria luteobubalina]